jgi:type IV pilus assembly protein PilY1
MKKRLSSAGGRQAILVAWFAIGCLTASSAMAQSGEAPKPVVMLLVDTSASMEWSSEAAIEATPPICHETRNAGFDYVKSRWAVAAEVLTGSFNDYWCSPDDRLDDPNREDYNAQPNHVMLRGVPVDGETQIPDGLLDLYRDSVKFGLMTFDPKPGTDISAAGSYSYGNNKTAFGNTTNWGAKNENATWGRLVSPPLDDDLVSVRQTNDLIQEQILAARPFNGTPVAPMLEDASYFFTNDERVKPYDEALETGDPYYDCRTKTIILITDGQPNLPYLPGTLGYLYAHVAAANLLAQGITVYVVGYKMPDPDAEATLNQIAEHGGTESAHIATNQAQLVAALGEILVEIQGNQPSQVTSAASSRTQNVDDSLYEFYASYSGTDESPLDQVGYLDQFIYRCDDTCLPEGSDSDLALCEVFSIAETLNNRVTTRLVSTQLAAELTPFAVSNPAITADVMGVPATGDLPLLVPYELDSGQKVFSGISMGDASSGPVRATYREQLINLLLGVAGSRRENIRMGAIVHSQLVLQRNLFTTASTIPSFEVYRNREAIRMRPSVLFAGTHDGQMHAFRVDRLEGLTESEFGEELWSFVPKHLLGSLNQLATGMAYLMDGPPVVKEVRLFKENLTISAEDEADLWRSVLISGYGEGGRGYFALNVTDPENYEFMWEISNTERCYNIPAVSSGCAATADFSRLGYSYSRPTIGNLFFSYSGQVQDRAVTIFGGGRSVTGEPDSGRSLYVVDLESGELLQEFCNSCGNIYDTNTAPDNTEFLDCTLAGPVEAFDTSLGGTISRAFVGDSCGQIWRLDLSSTDSSSWKMEFFHDAFTLSMNSPLRRPIRTAPALATGFSPGRLVVLYGTGGPEDLLSPGQADRVYSLSEYWTGSGFVADVNWYLQLQAGERFTDRPVVFNQIAHFTTQASGNSYCATGNGRLWGVDFDGISPDDINDVEAAMDEDGLAVTTSDFVHYIEYEDTELTGIELVQKPSCLYDPNDFEPWLGNTSLGAETPAFGSPYPTGTSGGFGQQFGGSAGGGLEIVAQTGETGVSSPDMIPPEGGGTVSTGNKTVKQLVAPTRSMFSSSWGLVFD